MDRLEITVDANVTTRLLNRLTQIKKTAEEIKVSGPHYSSPKRIKVRHLTKDNNPEYRRLLEMLER